jgi:hypothetical protein
MALFIVRHQHEPDRCPATDPYMGATLLNYLSRPMFANTESVSKAKPSSVASTRCT